MGIQIATQAAFLWDEEIQNAISYGNLIHTLMADIKSKDDISEVVEQAQSNGLIAVAEREFLVTILESITTHPDLQHCYSLENTILTERTILSSDGTFHIPDRIETSPQGKTTIIDYKTGERSLSHIAQIKRYDSLLTEMGFEVEKNLLVYINSKVDVLAV